MSALFYEQLKGLRMARQRKQKAGVTHIHAQTLRQSRTQSEEQKWILEKTQVRPRYRKERLAEQILI